MEKVKNQISNFLLLSTIASSYLMWYIGIGTKVTSFLYDNNAYILFIVVILILTLKMKEFEKKDWYIIIGSVAFFLFFTLTSSMRQSNLLVNASLPTIMLLLLCFKKSKFKKIDFTILSGITLVSLSLTLYRLTKEQPIWINPNTTSASILFSVVTLTILMKWYLPKGLKLLVIPLYLASLTGIWVCQGKTALAALILFILFDTFVSKEKLKSGEGFIVLILLLFTILPVSFYLVSSSETINLFSGREKIWQEFFDLWFADLQNVVIGMAPFISPTYSLGIHNGYLSVLNNFGIVGYLIFSSMILVMTWDYFRWENRNTLSFALFFAFICVLIMSSMEDVFLAYPWMPIVYSFIGISIFQPEQVANSEPDIEPNTRQTRSSRYQNKY